MPLEFFAVINGTSEHESVLRSPAKPSHVHLGLVMIGLEPGSPVKYSEAAKKWVPARTGRRCRSRSSTSRTARRRRCGLPLDAQIDEETHAANDVIFAGSRT